jgi:hypothetical protein
MTSTIETNNSNILKKIECLYAICEFINHNIPNSGEFVSTHKNGINEIFNSYSVESAIILADYFSISDNNKITKSKEQYNRLYQRYIKSNNIAARLDSIYSDVYRFFVLNTKPNKDSAHEKSNFFVSDTNARRKEYESYLNSLYDDCASPRSVQEVDNAETTIIAELDDIENSPTSTQSKAELRLQKDGNSLFSEYTRIKIHMYVEEIKMEGVCKICKDPMIVTNMGELSCMKCGFCCDAIITIIDDESITNDAKNIKYGTYDPSKHCRYWLDRIQGREIADMMNIELLVEEIKEYLTQSRIKNHDHVTYNLIRTYLRKSGKSAFNEHIPLIRKLITGISPPQLSESELQKVNIYFIRIIKLYNTIKPSTKINCPYHPYIIYKILEQILANSPRKTAILKCIHLQSIPTLIQNDRIWKKICEYIPEFTYIPTDRIWV